MSFVAEIVLQLPKIDFFAIFATTIGKRLLRTYSTFGKILTLIIYHIYIANMYL